jgi:succinate dehydrogenase/fumarate reductase flavoprotein subunit
MGFGLNHAMVTGTAAGINAAMYASHTQQKADRTTVDKVKQVIVSPVERKGGFSPGWVARVLRGFVTPYFITQVKHKNRLEPALQLVEFLNSHIVPRMFARDAHEWRMAQETRNMVLNSEMVLRASLFRTESRGSHFREDYPRRDDPAWLVWVKLREENGSMKAIKEPIPRQWWPDLSKSYEERYPSMLPLEQEQD